MIFSSLYSTREFHSLNVIVLFQIRANMLLAFRQKAVLDTDYVPVEWVHNRYRSIIKFSAQINELVSFWLSRRPFENFEISFTFNKAWKANKWLNLTRFNRFLLTSLYLLLTGLWTWKGIMGILLCNKDMICSRVIYMIRQYSCNIWRVKVITSFDWFVIGFYWQHRPSSVGGA